MRNGFDSHYLRTGYKGFPLRNGRFDELVVNQEHQVVPAFIVTFTKESLKKKYADYCEGNNEETKNPSLSLVQEDDEIETDQESQSEGLDRVLLERVETMELHQYGARSKIL